MGCIGGDPANAGCSGGDKAIFLIRDCDPLRDDPGCDPMVDPPVVDVVARDGEPISYNLVGGGFDFGGGVEEVEPNDTIGQAQDVDNENWNLDFSANIGDESVNTSEEIPHISINGTGDGSFDVYSFTVGDVPALGIFDIDFGQDISDSFDPHVYLYNSGGTPLADDDDSPTGHGQGGSFDSFDSYLEYTFTVSGTYFIEVAKHSRDPVTGDYQLQISLENHALQVASGATLAEGVDSGAKGGASISDTELTIRDDVFDGVGYPVFNDLGQVLFATVLDGFDSDENHLFRYTPGPVNTVKSSGGGAHPAIPPEPVYDRILGFGDPFEFGGIAGKIEGIPKEYAINNAGEVAFKAGGEFTGLIPDPDESFESGNLVLNGDFELPGYGAGAVFTGWILDCGYGAGSCDDPGAPHRIDETDDASSGARALQIHVGELTAGEGGGNNDPARIAGFQEQRFPPNTARVSQEGVFIPGVRQRVRFWAKIDTNSGGAEGVESVELWVLQRSGDNASYHAIEGLTNSFQLFQEEVTPNMSLLEFAVGSGAENSVLTIDNVEVEIIEDPAFVYDNRDEPDALFYWNGEPDSAAEKILAFRDVDSSGNVFLSFSPFMFFNNNGDLFFEAQLENPAFAFPTGNTCCGPEDHGAINAIFKWSPDGGEPDEILRVGDELNLCGLGVFGEKVKRIRISKSRANNDGQFVFQVVLQQEGTGEISGEDDDDFYSNERLLLIYPDDFLFFGGGGDNTPPQAGFGQALALDGEDDYVLVPGNGTLDLEGALTIEAWVNLDSLNGEDVLLANGAASGDDDYNFGVDLSGGRPGIWNNAFFDVTSPAPVLEAGRWHHLAITFSGPSGAQSLGTNGVHGTATIYVDGEPVHAGAWGTAGTAKGGDLVIGRDAGGKHFGGMIDELRIWNVARDQDQIRDYMKQPLSGLESGLKAYYNFNGETETCEIPEEPEGASILGEPDPEPEEVIISDFSGNLNDGTIVNGDEDEFADGQVPIVASVDEGNAASDETVTILAGPSGPGGNAGVAIRLFGFDAEEPAGNLTVDCLGSPSHGMLDGCGSLVTYTPEGDYNGTDQFTFRVTDSGIGSGPPEPVAVPIANHSFETPPVAPTALSGPFVDG